MTELIITSAADARRARDEIAGGAYLEAIDAIEAKIRELEFSGADGTIVSVPVLLAERIADVYRGAGWEVRLSDGVGTHRSLGLSLTPIEIGYHPDRKQADGSPIMDFWRFVQERMLVWDRKVNLEQPRPWTDDPVLRDRFFTNIFRDLDPGTAVAEKIVSKGRPAWERLWNLMMYRRFNREETWNLIGYHKFASTDADHDLIPDMQDHLRELYVKLAKYRTESGLPLWTDAHQVFPMPNLGGPADVTSRFFRVQLDLADPKRNPVSIYGLTEQLQAAETRKEAYRALLAARIPGVSNFMSWQLTMDCTYGPNPIVTADDDWAPITTGARTGAIMVKEWPRVGTVNYPAEGWDPLPPTPPAELERFVRALEESQDTEFEGRGIDFSVWNRRLDMSALEHALCEYSKYLAAAVGMPTRDRWAQATATPSGRRPFDPKNAEVVAAVEAIVSGSTYGPPTVTVTHPKDKGKPTATNTVPPANPPEEKKMREKVLEVLNAELEPAPRENAETRFKEAVRAIHRRGKTPTSRAIFEELDMRSVSLNSRQAGWRREELARLGYELVNGNYVLPYGRREEETE